MLEREETSQRHDDAPYQRPQEFAGLKTASTDGWDEPLAYEEPGFAEVEDELSPDEPEALSPAEARRETVRRVVAGLSTFERRCYELAYGPALMSSREIARELEDVVSYKTVQRALDGIKAKVAEALEDRAEAS